MFWLLASQFVRHGHEVVAITSDTLDTKDRAGKVTEELAPGIMVYRFRNAHTALAARLPIIFNRPHRMREELPAFVRSADVVHMGESRGIVQFWTANACRRSQAPLVWSAYGGLGTAPGIRGPYRRLHDVLLTSRIVPDVSRFLAQTEHEEAIYRKLGAPAAHIRRIPLCVDWSEFERRPNPGALRERLGITADDHLIVSVARLSVVKGLDALIEALAATPTTRRRTFLALVGADFGQRAPLTRLATRLGVGDRVLFPGGIYADDRLTAYVDADIFALAPAVYEETSLAALEAAACGTATVLSPQCEIPGLAAAQGGLVVERSALAISEAFGSLLKDEKLRLRMGAHARDYVASTLTAEIVAAQHEAVFAELVA
jgi:glycosyltransferase involved in cell wall biosynthesis